jgi:small basic protein
MGKFIGGLLIGLVLGLVFSENLFPEGFNNWVQSEAQDMRNHVPGR